jgi:hypothetical protein
MCMAYIVAGNGNPGAHAAMSVAFGRRQGEKTKLAEPSTGTNEPESTQPHECDWRAYVARYPDLQTAYGNDAQRAAGHYRKWGKGEGRNCSAANGDATGQPFKCTTEDDCQLNGDCVGGVCDCSVAWRGFDCSLLFLLPARDMTPAYPPPELQESTSSWGGSVIQDKETGYTQ